MVFAIGVTPFGHQIESPDPSFHESIVTATNYLDMLEVYAIPQLDDLQLDIFFQQDGAPPHWGLKVR